MYLFDLTLSAGFCPWYKKVLHKNFFLFWKNILDLVAPNGIDDFSEFSWTHSYRWLGPKHTIFGMAKHDTSVVVAWRAWRKVRSDGRHRHENEIN
jgi:hypothetical protein